MADDLDRARRHVDAWQLGQTSARYESSGLGPATISTGHGDHGGVSYGAYQLSHKAGTLAEYLRQSKHGAQFQGLEPATPAFNAKWKYLANSDRDFAQDQHEFIGRSHFDEQVEVLKYRNLDFTNRGRAVQDALWSTSVQLRHLTPRIFAEGLREKYGPDFNLSELSDRDIVTAVQDYKITHNNALFRSSPRLWNGLLNRAQAEKESLTRLADSEALLALSGQYRDWRLGPATAASTPKDPMALYRSNLQHIREGDFAALGMVHPTPAPQPPARPHQPDALADGVLRPGERGAAVGELQRHLNAQAVQEGRQPPLSVDNVYGRYTRQAVENFQLWNGLPTTGIADRETLAAVRAPRGTLTAISPGDAADLNPHEELRNRSIAAPALAADPGRPPLSPPVQSQDPRDQTHPDHALYEQIRTGVEELDARLGRRFDANSERMSASLLVMARERGFTVQDHLKIALNTSTATLAAGELVHLFRVGNRASPDPAANHAQMATAQALSVPVEESYSRLEALRQTQAGGQLQQLQQLQREQHGPSRSGPVMPM